MDLGLVVNDLVIEHNLLSITQYFIRFFPSYLGVRMMVTPFDTVNHAAW